MQRPMPILDSGLLIGEVRNQPMHVGGLQVFERPDGVDVPEVGELFREFGEFDHAQGIFAQRPRRSAASGWLWRWEDDVQFDITSHVHHVALPSPGDDEALYEACGRLHQGELDRSRPLWQTYFIDGLTDNRFAVYTKLHHSMIDGVSAMRTLQASMSSDPDERHCIPPWADAPRRPNDVVSPKGLPMKLFGASRAGIGVAADAATFPAAFARTALRTDGPWSFSAPRTPLNVPVTGGRKFVGRSWPIERFTALAAQADCRLNDVVLAACAGGLRRLLLEMSALPDAALTALVPVSLRGEHTAPGGNSIGAVLCNLGTNLDDPRQRLSGIIQSMHDSKEAFASMSKRQAEFMLALMLSPVALGRLFRFSGNTPPPFNLVISNVPGPGEQLHWNGARLRELFPLSLLVDGQALNISCASHADTLSFGAVACSRALPTVDRLFDHVEAGLAELERAVS